MMETIPHFLLLDPLKRKKTPGNKSNRIALYIDYFTVKTYNLSLIYNEEDMASDPEQVQSTRSKEKNNSYYKQGK